MPATPTPALDALSPLDGRYATQTRELSQLFSEAALIRQRVAIELEWLHTLAAEPSIEDISTPPPDILVDPGAVKRIEEQTRHDVKAVEYYIREQLSDYPHLEFLHFACTSMDINNIAYARLLQQARTRLLRTLDAFTTELSALAHTHSALPMLARTHGQPASPTTLGKELQVYLTRLSRQRQGFSKLRIAAKLNGATGNYNAHYIAYPNVDWPTISRRFIENMGLRWNPCTTQIEPYDCIAEYCHVLVRINTILTDLSRDFWGYISLDYFKPRTTATQTGSSTMPHKQNPIDFENAEGNLGIANTLLNHLALTLPTSRWQRDLTDSTCLRNIGVALGHTTLAWQNLRRGLQLDINPERISQDLDQAWEVLTEAVQTVMRKHNLPNPYEQLRQLAKQPITPQRLHDFITQLQLPQPDQQRLLQLTPHSYIGNAPQQVVTPTH